MATMNDILENEKKTTTGIRSYKKLRKGFYVKYFDKTAEEKHVELISGSYSKWNLTPDEQWFNCKNLSTEKCFSINLPCDGSKTYLAYDPLRDQEPTFPWDKNIEKRDFIEESAIVLVAIRQEKEDHVTDEDDDILEKLEVVNEEAMEVGQKIMDGMKTIDIMNKIPAKRFITEEEANLVMFEVKHLALKVAVLFTKAKNKTLTLDYSRTVRHELKTVYEKLMKIKYEAQMTNAEDNLSAMMMVRALEEAGKHLNGHLINLVEEVKESLVTTNLIKPDSDLHSITSPTNTPADASDCESEDPEIQEAKMFAEANYRELCVAKEEISWLKTQNKVLKDELDIKKTVYEETVTRLKRRIESLVQDLQKSKPNIAESKKKPKNKHERSKQEGEELKRTVSPHDYHTLVFINTALQIVVLLSNHCLPKEKEILRDMEKMKDKGNDYLKKLSETIMIAYTKLKPMEELLMSIPWTKIGNHQVIEYVKKVKGDLSKWIASAIKIQNMIKNLSQKENNKKKTNINPTTSQVRQDIEHKCILCKNAKRNGYNIAHFNIHKFSKNQQNVVPESCPLIRNMTVENRNVYLQENQQCRVCLRKLGIHKEENCNATLKHLKPIKCSKCPLRMSVCVQHKRFNESKLNKMKQKFEEIGLNFTY